MKRGIYWGILILMMEHPWFRDPRSPRGPPRGPSSELVGRLAKELGSTTKQAEGAAGSLFRLAKTRMAPETFSKVATAIPDMDQLLAAAPAIEAKGAAAGALGKKVGAEGLGSLAEVTQSFKKLGLKPDMVKKAVPVVTDYVGKKRAAGIWPSSWGIPCSRGRARRTGRQSARQYGTVCVARGGFAFGCYCAQSNAQPRRAGCCEMHGERPGPKKSARGSQ